MKRVHDHMTGHMGGVLVRQKHCIGVQGVWRCALLCADIEQIIHRSLRGVKDRAVHCRVSVLCSFLVCSAGAGGQSFSLTHCKCSAAHCGVSKTPCLV